MNNLSTANLLYLLHTQAYSNGTSVTKSVVKSHLSKELQKEAEQCYQDLIEKKLIQAYKRNRISVTPLGKKVLAANLRITKYRFNSIKGHRVINTILRVMQEIYFDYDESFYHLEEMNYETFLEKFKKLYFTERKQQELRGIVVIRSKYICQKFLESNQINQSLLEKYFNKLKSDRVIFAVMEKDEELIQWVE